MVPGIFICFFFWIPDLAGSGQPATSAARLAEAPQAKQANRPANRGVAGILAAGVVAARSSQEPRNPAGQQGSSPASKVVALSRQAHSKGCRSKVVASRLARSRPPAKPAVQPARRQAGGKVVAGSRQAHSKGRRSKVVAARLIAARPPSKPTVQAARSSPAAGRRSQAHSNPPAKVVAGSRQAHSKGRRSQAHSSPPTKQASSPASKAAGRR